MSSPMTTHQMIAAKGVVPAADWRTIANKKRAQRAQEKAAKARQLAADGAGFLELAHIFQSTYYGMRTFCQAHGIKVPHKVSARPFNPPRKELPMTIMAAPASPPVMPSSSAVKAQAGMFRLLDAHFDPDKGCYSPGWSDEKIAKDCGLAVALVAQFRREGFGELKEPGELGTMRDDIASLEKLLDETLAQFRQQISDLKSQMARLSARFGA